MGFELDPDDAATAVTVLVALLTIPSLRALVKRMPAKSPNLDCELYGDEDGVASEESTATFSNTTEFIFVFLFTVLGLGVSIADAIYTAVVENFEFKSSEVPLVAIWLLTLSWVSFCRTEEEVTCLRH
jgi:hypothetical protein